MYFGRAEALKEESSQMLNLGEYLTKVSFCLGEKFTKF
jgi:hypothetical protein